MRDTCDNAGAEWPWRPQQADIQFFARRFSRAAVSAQTAADAALSPFSVCDCGVRCNQAHTALLRGTSAPFGVLQARSTDAAQLCELSARSVGAARLAHCAAPRAPDLQFTDDAAAPASKMLSLGSAHTLSSSSVRSYPEGPHSAAQYCSRCMQYCSRSRRAATQCTHWRRKNIYRALLPVSCPEYLALHAHVRAFVGCFEIGLSLSSKSAQLQVCVCVWVWVCVCVCVRCDAGARVLAVCAACFVWLCVALLAIAALHADSVPGLVPPAPTIALELASPCRLVC